MATNLLEESTRLRDAAKLLLDDFQRRRSETERDLARQEMELQRNLQYYEVRLNRVRHSYGAHGEKVDTQATVAAERPQMGLQTTLRRLAAAQDQAEEYGAVTHAVEEFARLSGKFTADTVGQYIVQLRIRPDIETAKKSARSAIKGLLKRKFLRKTNTRGLFAYNKKESPEEQRLIHAQNSHGSEVSNR